MKEIRICFDVDGVLCDDSDLSIEYPDREPYEFVSKKLHNLKKDGIIIYIMTARYMVRCDGDQQKATQRGLWELKDWLKKWDIPYDFIYLGKPPCDLFVDDKACFVNSNLGEDTAFVNFDKCLELLKDREVKSNKSVLVNEV